ncbi:uncharacterized protein [Miscanthus floridulus]|uniref:uncharacterized protein n=1 Tax=Miscanthus floridulus TaxID=154761 RepID=UPI003458658A
MAPSFGRSISFQLSPARAITRPRAAAAGHVRSISLPPCRSHSHPLLAHLQAQTAAALAWATSASTSPSTGLALIDALHAALAELLLLPEPQTLVRRACASSDRLLDAFLLLADAHRGFQESLLALRRDAADARAALRRRDAARLASAARAQRRAEKDLARLAAAVSSSVARSARLAALGSATATAEETEMAAALMDAAAASAAASAAVFSAVASVSAATSSSKKAAMTFAAAFAKKPETADVAPEKLEELERCIDECESGREVVFRSIVRTRVSLLNIRTPAI